MFDEQFKQLLMDKVQLDADRVTLPNDDDARNSRVKTQGAYGIIVDVRAEKAPFLRFLAKALLKLCQRRRGFHEKFLSGWQEIISSYIEHRSVGFLRSGKIVFPGGDDARGSRLIELDQATARTTR